MSFPNCLFPTVSHPIVPQCFQGFHFSRLGFREGFQSNCTALLPGDSISTGWVSGKDPIPIEPQASGDLSGRK
ncbi:MAG: hypothetical protein E7122_05945 [Bacteroidales bacterium]|nr:hypothetical protein [Bacteroidales bacterium]